MRGYVMTRDGEILRRGGPVGTISEDRPVVVIDPEDREQVERLAFAIRDVSNGSWTESTQAALRSLIAAPKPPEPTGLGAVVVDEDGDRWVRIRLTPPSAAWVMDVCNNALPTHYDCIKAVKVLSQGVTS